MSELDKPLTDRERVTAMGTAYPDAVCDLTWAEVEELLASVPTNTVGGEPVGDLSKLRQANIDRQAIWCPDEVPDLSFRGNELGGEVGEALNVIKKLELERLGWRGSRDTVEHLAEELADVVICADLCAITAGIDLAAAVVAKFNATSDKVGIPVKLASTPTRDSAEGPEATVLNNKPVPQDVTDVVRKAMQSYGNAASDGRPWNLYSALRFAEAAVIADRARDSAEGREKIEPGTIRVCPERDARCPHGLDCPFWIDRGSCDMARSRAALSQQTTGGGKPE